MSAPFIYTPQSEYHAHLPHYPLFTRPFQQSPFNVTQTIYPSSPYVGPPLSEHGTPPPFSAAGFRNDQGSNSGWGTRRRRRPSWHGTSSPRVTPFIPPLHLSPSLDGRIPLDHGGPHSAPPQWPTTSPYLYPTTPFMPNVPIYPSSNYVPGYPQLYSQPPPQIHPWLNGDAPSHEFCFDLSMSSFHPQRLVGPDHAVPLTLADLQSPAFHPPVTKLRIVCDQIPNWPVDLVYGVNGFGGPPITLGDILVAIHQKLHQRISHSDFARLSVHEVGEVTRAFMNRCRLESTRRGIAFHSDSEERQQGVKVVDFLVGKTMFRGLVRTADGYIKMVVA
ncbi:hypothetical protein FB45DRAFT_207238 [Roridomyces roridus]|uniref:DUF6699 domain-containing protein n=1 Tax=Roridomyces roridus TaxID=1738132 RepID=A0AAD7CGG8_9AGAR|nr:hypothetical protein FB45DRAFT_207238 [Roridomyces roridus]